MLYAMAACIGHAHWASNAYVARYKIITREIGDYMTKKDYIKIAKIFNDHVQPREGYPVSVALIKEVAEDMASMLSDDNKAFDAARFMKAAGF